MKQSKKVFILVLTAICVLLLASCNKKNKEYQGEFKDIESIISYAKTLEYSTSGSSTIVKTGTNNFTVPTTGFDIDTEVSITFYHTMGSNLSTVLKNYITEFNKIYPNIKITEKQVGSYDDVKNQCMTELTTENYPNIAYCYADHVAMYNMTGKVVILDSLIDSTVTDGTQEGIIGLTQAQKDDFIEGYYNEGRQFGDGMMYTLPFSKSTEVLYYNQDFFTEHNLSIPTHWFNESANDTTSMEYVCAKIKEIDPECIPLGYDSEANWFITLCEQCGVPYTSATGDKYQFDNDTMISLMYKLRQWYQNGWITTQQLYGSYTSGLFVAETGQKSYMSIGSSAGATHQRPEKTTFYDENLGRDVNDYPFTVGITSIPQMSQTYKRVISQGPSVCIFKKTNPQEVLASWLFVKYLTTCVEFQAEFSEASGYVPVIKSVAQNATYASKLANANGKGNIAFLSAKVCLEQVDAYYTSPAFNGSSIARDQVGALLSKCLSGSTSTPKQFVLDAFQDAIDECEYNG